MRHTNASLFACGAVVVFLYFATTAPAAEIKGIIRTRGGTPLQLAVVEARWANAQTNRSKPTNLKGEYRVEVPDDAGTVRLKYSERRHIDAHWETTIIPPLVEHSETLIPIVRAVAYWNEVGRSLPKENPDEIVVFWSDLNRHKADPLDKIFLAQSLRNESVELEELGSFGVEINAYSGADPKGVATMQSKITKYLQGNRTVPTYEQCVAFSQRGKIPKLVMAESIGVAIAEASEDDRKRLASEFGLKWAHVRLENNRDGETHLMGLIRDRVDGTALSRDEGWKDNP